MPSTNIVAYANRNSDTGGQSDLDTIGEGKYKYVLKGVYDNGRPYVSKYMKSGATFSDECLVDDVVAAEAALPYIAGFHQYIDTTRFRGRVSIMMNMPEVWLDADGELYGQRMLVEPYIHDFQKFNSNSGAANLSAEVAQALSHYSYHASDGSELLCDLQGGREGNSYILSDVVIMSKAKDYGPTDLGITSIENWLHAHRCNQFCSPAWKNWTGARELIAPVFSTTLTHDAITSPAAYQDFIRLRPRDIGFTQRSIANRFRDGHTLLNTAVMIAKQNITKRDIRMITVVEMFPGTFFTLDNRRLAVFRLLEMCGRVGTIKVEVVPFDVVAGEWDRKYTSDTNGDSIEVRGIKNHSIGMSRNTTHFPGLNQIQMARPARVKPDDQFSVFLASFMDE